MKNKTELLAPAGNFESFIGALNAGADAFYLAGQKFGARAYADNFTQEEICRALHIAHFYGKKIYLTVNTLVKSVELNALFDFLYPFYCAGLDGVIIQDLGVFKWIREHFPNLELHVSTQMTVTDTNGALFLKDNGAVRIVPARELSLEEVKELKEKTGLSMECFIHGSMCYCYSGQCLFSSMLGGRSGNRGRCAQPCRLPYKVIEENGSVTLKEGYPLSLKDMCTLEYLPNLIESGIDSFKIEGRMKKPEYAAGVTAIYRKYIDLYYKEGKTLKVQKQDLDFLKNLYIRSEIQTGYYDKHNGKDMVTIHKPGYIGSNDELLYNIRKKYIHRPKPMDVAIYCDIQIGAPAQITIIGNDTSITVHGDNVQRAASSPIKNTDIEKQLKKTGNSCLHAESIYITLEDNCFLPVKSINELRRKAVNAFENAIIEENGLVDFRILETPSATDYLKEEIQNNGKQNHVICNPYKDCTVSSLEQLSEVIQYPLRRIYVDSDLFVFSNEEVTSFMQKHRSFQWFLSLPNIIRKRDEYYLESLGYLLNNTEMILGFLVRNIGEVQYVLSLHKDYQIIPDTNLYCFNKESILLWKEYTKEITLPYELNGKEWRELCAFSREKNMETTMVFYSRIPMMVTANCVLRTTKNCYKNAEITNNEIHTAHLQDRYHIDFPVKTNCNHCYNIIYNSVPYSLHTKMDECLTIGATAMRYDFTLESALQVRKILKNESFPFDDYTMGHFRRGVE